ncbi:MAG: NAD(P)-dependent alcohol dehydrogenase [Acidobacteriia bacterium]|nr:NAD(P)-dependent alcohol dehydrogenase [Terriglobia bacterium]
MKAAVNRTYGSPSVVRIEDVEKPIPKDDEVLIRVRAASVNPMDKTGMRGTPYLARLMGGLRKPKDTRMGVDVAGQVESVGKDVTDFKPGDEVFGMCKGAFAEYACTSESGIIKSALALKPPGVSFEQAAAVPVAGLTALQGLRDKGRIRPGHQVLIHGAAGGVGTFAVQIAKSFGAEVTGVCSTRNVSMVRSLGADRVIDYTKEDFTKGGQRYDILLDCIGDHSLFACRRVLTPKGFCVGVGAPHGRWLAPVDRLLGALVLSLFLKNLIPFIAKASPEDLTVLQGLIQAGKVTPVIDRRYPLSEVADALGYLEEGHVRGKVVITVE